MRSGTHVIPVEVTVRDGPDDKYSTSQVNNETNQMTNITVRWRVTQTG